MWQISQSELWLRMSAPASPAAPAAPAASPTASSCNDVVATTALFLNNFAFWRGHDHRHRPLRQDPKAFEKVASMALSEDWGERFKVLESYLEHTFKRVRDEQKIFRSCKGEAIFDTGLFTRDLEPIYAVFTKNNRHAPAPEFVFRSWLTRREALLLQSFAELPSRAHYFDDPFELLFDGRVKLEIFHDHIMREQEQRRRLEAVYTGIDESRLRDMVSMAKRYALANMRSLVPQYFRREGLGHGVIQLLMPLRRPDTGDVIAVIPLEKRPRVAGTRPDHTNPNSWFYVGNTVLTLEMAYNNARLLSRIESDWLKPQQKARNNNLDDDDDDNATNNT